MKYKVCLHWSLSRFFLAETEIFIIKQYFVALVRNEIRVTLSSRRSIQCVLILFFSLLLLNNSAKAGISPFKTNLYLEVQSSFVTLETAAYKALSPLAPFNRCSGAFSNITWSSSAY